MVPSRKLERDLLCILSLIGSISLVLFLVAVCYILYSGLTTEIHIRTGLPPVRSITIAYKYKVGPYKDCGSLFRESCSIGPKLPCIGIFYDDPKKERKLCAHPFLEIYKGGMIHYMGPLARQGDFYVPEVREAQRWLLGKESEEDGRTDITGKLIIQFTDALKSLTRKGLQRFSGQGPLGRYKMCQAELHIKHIAFDINRN
uniref:Testis expressed 264, ER-phagy receptor n=1 Tax=Sinocyclocheilus rhinocerous TaxID=307959 RepID=A0A673FRX3_9TELE